jgi:hypothetical protein
MREAYWKNIPHQEEQVNKKGRDRKIYLRIESLSHTAITTSRRITGIKATSLGTISNRRCP